MPKPADFNLYRWKNIQTLRAVSYLCGYCGNQVSSEKGYSIHHSSDANRQDGAILICPQCNNPTFATQDGRKIPGSAAGRTVLHVPKDLDSLYAEARDCHANSAYTATVLLCRKILMNIAVSQKAKEGLRFIEYVDYLASQGYVPPNGRHWVDHIRQKGNEANHEITLMNSKDSNELLLFIEMLLKFIYEFPNLVPKPEKS